MLNARDMASLSVKLLGIYALIQSVPMLEPVGTILGMLTTTNERIPGLSLALVACSAVPFILLVVGGLVLLLCAGSIGAKLAPAMADNGERNPSAVDVQAIAFAAIGVFAFVMAAPKLLEILVNLYAMHTSETARAGGVRALPHIVGLVAQVAAGAGLFFGARGLSIIWQRARGRCNIQDK